MIFTSALASALLISQVAGTTIEPLLPRDALGLASILPRQSRNPGTAPEQCKTSCPEAIFNALNICISTLCLCSEDNAKMLESCVECIVGLAPSRPNISAGQAVIDKFSDTCKNSSIPSLTLTASGTDASSPATLPPLPTIPHVLTVSPPAEETPTGTGLKETNGAKPSTPSPSPSQAQNNSSSRKGVLLTTGLLASALWVLGMFTL